MGRACYFTRMPALQVKLGPLLILSPSSLLALCIHPLSHVMRPVGACTAEREGQPGGAGTRSVGGLCVRHSPDVPSTAAFPTYVPSYLRCAISELLVTNTLYHVLSTSPQGSLSSPPVRVVHPAVRASRVVALPRVHIHYLSHAGTHCSRFFEFGPRRVVSLLHSAFYQFCPSHPSLLLYRRPLALRHRFMSRFRLCCGATCEGAYVVLESSLHLVLLSHLRH